MHEAVLGCKADAYHISLARYQNNVRVTEECNANNVCIYNLIKQLLCNSSCLAEKLCMQLTRPTGDHDHALQQARTSQDGQR